MIDDHLVLVDTLLFAARPVVAVAAPAVLNVNVNVDLGVRLLVALAADALRQLHQLLDVLLRGVSRGNRKGK